MSLQSLSLQAISLQTMLGLTGISLLLSVTLLRVLLFFKLKKQLSYFIAILLFATSFVSFSGDTINFYFRGLFNDLSITSLILLSYYFIQPETDKKQTQPIFLLLVITGLFFYPTALGLGPVDPYAWGFISKDHGITTPLIFLSLLAGLMYFALVKSYSILLLSLVLATLCYHSGLLESRNIWDYLFDPLVFIYALTAIISSLFSKKNNPFFQNQRL